ncbi:hypothetical protein EX30DRAFT_367137 [Ascodesmis nigricans]|uniref:MARVEL domain-containing protein n=1 Tax=Ascodesmis nigricans TaxID=341454 RepID=A0A4V3SHM6_9PEZI|nr:hypothetical protein EX30DRAFT_367137 [Ascodesmis nigricans]
MAIRASRTGRAFSILRILQLAMLLTMLGLLAIYGVHLSRLSPPSMPMEFLFALTSSIFITLSVAVTFTLHHFSHAPYLSSLLLSLPTTAFLLASTILLLPRETCPSLSPLPSASPSLGYFPALAPIPSKSAIRLAFPFPPDARSHTAWLLRVRSTCVQMTAAGSLAAGVSGLEVVVAVMAGVLWRRVRRVPGVEREREWRVEVGSVGGGLEEEVRTGAGKRPGGFERVRTSDSGVGEEGDGGYGHGGEAGREGVTSGEWEDVDWERNVGGYYGASTQRTPPVQMI